MTKLEFSIELDRLLDEFCYDTDCDRCPCKITCDRRNKLSEVSYTVELVENILTDKRSEIK